MDPSGPIGVGGQTLGNYCLCAGCISASVALRRKRGRKLLQCLSHNSLGDGRLPGSSFLCLSLLIGHLRIAPVTCLAGGSRWQLLFPQPSGKLECRSSAKEIPSLGAHILCAIQLHPSSLKTFQAT